MSTIGETLKRKPGFVSLGGVSEEKIKEAEIALNLRFSDEYRNYLLEIGTCSFLGHELTGICGSPRLNVVDVTQAEIAKNPQLIPGMYVIEQLEIDGALIWQNQSGEIYSSLPGKAPRKISKSLYDYILS